MTTGKYILWTTGLLFLCLALMAYPVMTYFTPDQWPFFWFAVVLSAVSSMGSYAIVAAGIKIRIQRFMSYIMGGMMIKLAVGIASITVVAYKYKDYAAIYVLSYFAAYLIFTAFEVYTLMRNLRPQNQKGSSISHEDSGHK